MDEISPYESGEIINTSLVEEKLDDSTLTTLKKLPVHLCMPLPMTAGTEGADIDEGTPISTGSLIGKVVLPDDFLKLAVFKMTEWERPVIKPITEDNPKYNLQQNEYTRGGVSKPVVVIKNDANTGKKILEYYTVKTSHAIETATYVKKDKPENLPDEIVEAIAYQCATDLYLIQEMPKQAEIALSKLNEFIQLNTY